VSAFLPQRDPKAADRQDGLNKDRKTYQYSYTHVSPLAVLDRLPYHDEFSWTWMKIMGERVLASLHNQVELEENPQFADYLHGKKGWLASILSAGVEVISGLKTLVGEALKFPGRWTAQPTRAQTLKDFAELFRTIGLPPIANVFETDESFARMRLAGPNPTMLRRVTNPYDGFPITNEIYQSVLPGDSLTAAMAEGRLFSISYHALADVEPSSFPHGQKYLYAPLALFAVEKATKRFLPVAIQCRPTPGPDNPLFTPHDGYAWQMAKTVLEIADANYHELITHLGLTHLLLEPFVITTFRQLARNHPLRILLMPHFEGTLAVNDAAWKYLIADRGGVDKLAGGTIEFSRGLTVKSVQTFSFTHGALPRRFKTRGVDSTEWLADYPYRDDTLLYWDAIHDWVRDYLGLYYLSDQDVWDDSELRAWCAEVTAMDGGRLNGLPVIETRDDLVEAVTMVIYTASAQHAAVNFPQYDLMSYAPNIPLAGYAPAPTSKTGATEQDYLAMLPPLNMAELQMELGYLLGTVHYTTLGQYEKGYFKDPAVAAPLAIFQEKLKEVGEMIAERNRWRRPYEVLLPDGIPQSINV
jgi:arachidonate 15-lipoxygenase